MGLNLSSAILLLAAGDDSQRVVRHRPLHRQSFGSIRGQPLGDFGQRRQNDRHGFGWIGATTALASASVVRKPNSSCRSSTGALFGPRTAAPGRP